LQNNALNDIRNFLRLQAKRNKDVWGEYEELSQAIQQIEEELQVSAMLKH